MSQRWNRNVILIAGFILVIIQIGRLVVAQNIHSYFQIPKCEQINLNGVLNARCGQEIEDKNKDQNHYLPANLSRNLEILDLTPKNSTEYVRFDFYAEDFQRYPKLRRVIIRRLKPSTIKNINSIFNSYATCFKDVPSIHNLEFSNSSLSNRYTITWPKNLRILKVDDNEFQSLDVQECKELQVVSANGNQLMNVPKFHYPLPPIKTLHLKGNPLDNMTILNLAPLCELSLLELEFPPGAHYIQKDSTMSYCDCTMLKKWAKEAEILGPDKIECFEPKKKVGSCSEAIFDKAKRLHTRCPFLKSQKSIPILTILRIVLFFILTFLMLSALVLFVVRYFHLREKLASIRGQSPEASTEASTADDEPSKSSETEDEKSSTSEE